jgi:hypothetical protein
VSTQSNFALPSPRTVLELLPKARLLELSRELGVSVRSSVNKEEQVSALAAREGVNLQGHCSDLFHYDIPRNPGRLAAMAASTARCSRSLRSGAATTSSIRSGQRTKCCAQWCAFPPGVRVLNSIFFYTAVREGEGCGLTWRQWTRDSLPLGPLAVDWQYDHKPLKMEEQPRRVPVHPVLAKALDWWWRDGFALTYGRAPALDDFIVPRLAAGRWNQARILGIKSESHTKGSGYKAFTRACEKLDIECRSLHSTRHSAITAARRGDQTGALLAPLERITHNAKGAIIDCYTHWGTGSGDRCAMRSWLSRILQPRPWPPRRARWSPSRSRLSGARFPASSTTRPIRGVCRDPCHVWQGPRHHWEKQWRRRESKTSGDGKEARFCGKEARFDTRGRRVPGESYI